MGLRVGGVAGHAQWRGLVARVPPPISMRSKGRFRKKVTSGGMCMGHVGRGDYSSRSGGGGSRTRPPFFVPRCRLFLTLGPKLDPPLDYVHRSMVIL